MSWISRLKATGKSLDNMEDLVLHEMRELYSVENQLIHSLPDMARAASAPELRKAFQNHLEQTKRQKERLEQAFRQLGRQPESEKSEGMKGILEEGDMIAHMEGDPAVKDAALIAAAQCVEHYEMAVYGSACAFASRIGRQDVADILHQTLDEEKATDRQLTELAETGINPRAAHQGGQ